MPDTIPLPQIEKGFSTTDPVDYSMQSPLVLPGYRWDHYVSLDELFQNTGVRVRFLKNHIELMPPISEGHESRKRSIGYLVETWCLEREIDVFAQGSTTLKKEGEGGGEPDESYCFHQNKDCPDLAIEIALTSGGLSKREFYQVFRVPEVWIWRKERLEVYILNKGGDYEASGESLQLPGLDLSAIEQCATLTPMNRAVKEFRRLIEKS